MEWTRTAISADSVTWLKGLPERRALESCELVHGSLREPLWEYVTSPAVARDNLDLLRQPIGLHGHTHLPVAFVEEGGAVAHFGPRDGSSLALEGRRALVNPGSVGQPRDGDPRSSYLILDPGAGTMTWHRVAYDIESVQAAMRAVGLPGYLVSRLSIGL
jgi:diadenosine tetraphosphatase ApaH/serine/threonine PP2A family protein phosphatase